MYKQIYEFAASAGALEGYVYQKPAISEGAIAQWCKNLVTAYNLIPADVRKEFQTSCNGTIGRAIHSLLPHLGAEHELIGKLQAMIVGTMPVSADDFQKDKGF